MFINKDKRVNINAVSYILMLLIFSFCIYTANITAAAEEKSDEVWPQAPEISAPSAVLIDADSGKILYEKDANEKRYPASITKILTALITIEDSNLSDTMTFKGEALTPLPEGYVSIHPHDGEQMSVEDCLNGLLLESANDAANGLAVHDAGTISAFAQKMNERAKLAGAINSNFVNPSGLSNDNHYTTAYDMAMIMRDCIQYEEFLDIAGSLTYTIPATNKSPARVVNMRHSMLKPDSSNYYEYCKAGKTGFTTPAGRTLITYAEKDGVKLIACVLKCNDGEQYKSTRALFDYGFDNFDIIKGYEFNEIKHFINSDDYALNVLQSSPLFDITKEDSSTIIVPLNKKIWEIDAVTDRKIMVGKDGYTLNVKYEYAGRSLGTGKIYVTKSSKNLLLSDSFTPRKKEVLVHGVSASLFKVYECIAAIIGIILIYIIFVVYIMIIKPHRERNMVPDYEKAKAAFEKYLNTYDRSNEKIALKIKHTYGVVEACKEISELKKLSEEDKNLALIIGLLHDIGRFEQIKKYDSFEPSTMNHALEGVDILFEQGLIRDFVKNNKWDSIIEDAILYHSDYKLPDLHDLKTELHAKIIRDADKLDNCRVKLEEPIEILLGKSKDEVGTEEISEDIYKTIMNHKSIKLEDRKTKLDYWVSYIAYMYDINFTETLSIVDKNDYVNKIIDRIPYTNEESKVKMQNICKDVDSYIKRKIKLYS